MTTTTSLGTTGLSGSALASLNGTAGTTGTGTLNGNGTAQDQSDRFLKLLVAQMQNQDPLNPMDSAQVTSQMAQISTVEGVQTLNTTMTGLNSQFVQMQTMQGAALVGHTVGIEGNALHIDPATGKGTGGMELSAGTTSVEVEIDDPSGNKIGTVEMGPQTAGRHDFSFDVPEANRSQALTFKVTAMAGSTAVDTLSLAYNRISAVSTLNGQIALELDNGKRVSYDAVWDFQ